MEEKQALLYKEQNFHRNPNRYGNDDGQELSSEGSEEWWDHSGSSCSSCCDYHSRSSYEWEVEITENGELFYIESEPTGFFEEVTNEEEPKPETLPNEKPQKETNIKAGRLVNWMRRRDSKKLESKPEITAKNQADKTKTIPENGEGCKEIALRIDSIGQGTTLCEKLLGLSLDLSDGKKAVVADIRPDGPAKYSRDIAVGDILSKINNYNVVPHNVENILGSITFPNEVYLKIQKTERCETPKRYLSNLAKTILERNEGLDTTLLEHPVGIVVIDMESQNLNKDDVVYTYPEKCVLSLCRGAFVTLFHLLGEINANDQCQSSSILMKKQRTHVLYKCENNLLLLLAIPQSRCTLKEATLKVNDLIRNLLFSYQTLKRCFETSKKSDLDHFFSLFFSFLLTNELSAIGVSENPPPLQQQLEDIMPYATWLPLPREAQIQMDDALNELEANDMDHEEENLLESQRLFNMIGSCLFHKGYALASHLPKEDLLDVYAFYRQNCLRELFRSEPVKSLVIWKEVFPHSVNRGLPSRKPTSYPLPTGKWFLLIVGQGFDSLALLLEIGNCCAKMDDNAGPSIPYVEEAEDTLRHIRKLGITSLASQWIENNKRFKTTTPEEVFAKKANRKRDNLLGFVKPFEGTPKAPALNVSSGSSKSSDTNASKKLRQQEMSEDSMSQTASNVSEVSDENVPILGRRGERRRTSVDQTSDSDSSDSDWDSSRGSNMRESICSSGADNFYLGDVGDVIPAKLTTGSDYLLFHYVQLDGNEGVLVSTPSSITRSTPKMSEILDNFKRCALIIHSTLENSIKFKKNSQDGGKCFINKSLAAVKEHGVLYECTSVETDGHKKPLSLTYWIVGRLFFTPQPREVYVCYHEEAPQNLVEIAFRLGLCAAG